MQTVVKANVYETIVAEIKKRIELGVWARGEKLPSVRAYAIERRVNPNTVAKAYAALEADGYIVIQLKKGAYVCYGENERKERLDGLKRELSALKEKGVEREEMEKILHEIYKGGGES